MSSFHLYDAIPEGVFVVDDSYHIVFWNQRMEFWSKRSKKNIQGKNLLDIYPHIRSPRYIKRINNLLSGAPTVLFSSQLNPHFIPLQHSPDKLKIVYTTVSLFTNANVNYFIFCVQDFTNHRNNILEIEKLRKSSQQAYKYKGKFLATISHELRTPLNGILGLTQLTLDSPDLSDENLENLTLVKYSGEKLLNLISDILDLSKIEAQQLVLESNSFSFPNDLLLNIQSLALKAHQKDLDIFLDFDPNIPKKLIGDITRLNQVLTNLIGNAIKFTPQGNVTIKASCKDLSKTSVNILFEVIDTGIGIEESQFKSIFNSYIQAAKSTAREYGGTGLGTAISKEIIELMGGEIWIESQLNQGSKFQFLVQFPIDLSFEQKIESSNHLKLKKVLFYSPSYKFISNIETKLTPYNYQFTSTKDLSVFTKKLPSKFDFIFIDFVDNLNLIQQASNLTKTIVFKNITSKIRSKNSNVLILTKPIYSLKLIEAIQTFNSNKSKVKNISCEPSSQSKSLKVLVVDDNKINQKLAKKLLNKLNHQVEIANGGYEAIDKSKKTNFDLILMDISMPDLNGYEATEIIRSFDKKTPIVAMTANSYQEDKQKCLSSEMNAYMEKPINFASVQTVLDAIIDNKEIHLSYEQNHEVQLYSLEKLLSLFENEKDYALEMINSFISSSENRLKLLRSAIQEKNTKLVQFEVHSLKGISLLFNAMRFIQILKELQETSLKDQNNVLALYDLAYKEYQNIKYTLNEYKRRL